MVSQTSSKQAPEAVEGEEREFCKLFHIPSEEIFGVVYFSGLMFAVWGGRKNKKRRDSCNANEHIYKALPAMLSSSSLLFATLEDVLVAVAQKALSGLLYFFI